MSATIHTMPRSVGAPTHPVEVSNRFWKAARFAAALHACKITSQKVYGFELTQWDMLARGLREDMPSHLTRFEIVSLLELLEEAEIKYARIAGLGGCA